MRGVGITGQERLALFAAGACVLLGALLRLYNLGTQGFWYDEIATAQVLRFETIGETVSWVQQWGDHAPLSYLLTWALRGTGGGEFALRLPYAVAGVLSVAALYALARALLPLRAALLATLLVATAPFAIYYSQEARPYAFIILFTTLQMLASYRAATRSSPWDWLALTVLSILNLYTSYLSIFPTAAAFTFAALAALAQSTGRWRGTTGITSRELTARRLMLALAALLTALAYLPWLPSLRLFLERRDLGFGRLRGYNANLADTYAAFEGLHLGGLLLVLLCVGLGTAIAWSVRGRIEGWLMLLWLVLPLVVFLLAGGSTIVTLPSRYFSFLFPLALLLVALGVYSAAQGVGWAARRLNSRGGIQQVTLAGRIAYPLFAIPILVQTTPTLLQQYAAPKAEFREAARHVTSSSPPGSAVLVLGAFNTSLLPPLVRETVAHYYELWDAPIEIIDATRLGGSDLEQVESAGGNLWAALFTEPRPSDLDSARAAGFEVLKLDSITMLRPPAALSVKEQALAVLRWGTDIYPALSAARVLFDEDYRQSSLGENLLPPSPTTFDVSPSSSITIETTRVEAGKLYVLLFACGNSAREGEQRLFVDTFDASGTYLETLPEGYGYLCLRDPLMPLQATAFRATNGIATLRIRLTATGTTRYMNLELRPLLAP
jgi:4-amino-4-deoxy-L-arabinose transferase-like glycosyltransferase